MSGAYDALFTGALLLLGLMMIACLGRAILGPRVADRLVAINMTGTIAIMMIALLAVAQDEGYLVDVAIIYALLSFLAVVALVKILIGVYRGEKRKRNGGAAK